MTLILSYIIGCSCGEEFSAPLHSSINVTVDPELKDQLLRGEINKVACPNCRQTFIVETILLYHDMEKNLMIWMAPKVDGVSRDDKKYMEIERRIQALQKRIDEIKQKRLMPARKEERPETHKKAKSRKGYNLLAYLSEKAKEGKPKKEMLFVRGMDALIRKIREIENIQPT